MEPLTKLTNHCIGDKNVGSWLKEDSYFIKEIRAKSGLMQWEPYGFHFGCNRIMCLNKVYYAPEINKNLISVYQLIKMVLC